MLISEDFGNPNVAVDGRELTRNIKKRRSKTFCKPVDVHSVKNVIDESIASIRTWNIVNQLGKYDFSCGWVVNNLKERQLFSD